MSALQRKAAGSIRGVRLFGMVACAVFAVYGIQGQTQSATRTSGILIDRVAPPPIERGISPLAARSPDDPAIRRELSVAGPRVAAFRVGASGARYRPGRIIVKFRDGSTTASRVSALRAVSRTGSLSTRPDHADFDIITTDPNDDAESIARAFLGRPDVEYAQAAYRVRSRLKPNDRFYPRQWNLPLVDMERAWDVQPAAGSSITVAVLDTGIAFANATMRYRANSFVDLEGRTYPALGDLTLQFVAASELAPFARFVAPRDFIWDNNLPLDLDGHGTHVSGTLGQLTNNGASGIGDVGNGGGTAGVAFNVKLMPVKVLDTDWDAIFGSPFEGTDELVAQGIRYAADNGANIINMSLGRTGPATCGTNPSQNGCSPVIEAAINYAVGKGCFVAVAGGNEFEDGNPTEVIGDIASRIRGAVSVGAVDPLKNHAFYSNTGPWLELVAPGGSFRGFDSGGGVLQQTLDLDLVETFDLAPSRFTAPRFDSLAYFYFIGTSMAVPHVAGMAAMLVQQGITDPAAIEAALERFALDLGSPGRDNTFGYGLVNARNTLRGLGLAR